MISIFAPITSDAEAARIQKIVDVPQLQFTDEKVDITAESSEDSVDDAGPVHHTAIMRESPSSPSSTAKNEDASDSGPGIATEW